MRRELINLENSHNKFTPEEMHVFSWSDIMLNGLKGAVYYYANVKDKQSNTPDEVIDSSSPTSLNYFKSMPNRSVFVAVDLDDDSTDPTYLASYDYTRSLPLKYIDQAVTFEAQMVVSDYEDGEHLFSYEFFKNIDPNSELRDKTTIVRREFEKRLYLRSVSGEGNNTEVLSKVELHPKFAQKALARVLDSHDAHQLSEYMPH